MSDATKTKTSWSAWRVAPDSGFEVSGSAGEVGLVQIDTSRFLVTNTFRFSNDAVEESLRRELMDDGRSPEEAQRAVDDARTFTPTTENPTDMASIPPFMRWFENSYGQHTLAAIVHDQLIVDEPNGGALGSDTLADRFFREMMRTAGVAWLKRWIMWAAVALRSRWAAGGIRRISLCVWILVAIAGIASFVNAVGSVVFDWGHPFAVWILLVTALVLPIASAPLWGKQFGASLVAAAAAAWILPAAIFAALGYVVYQGLEFLADKLGLE